MPPTDALDAGRDNVGNAGEDAQLAHEAGDTGTREDGWADAAPESVNVALEADAMDRAEPWTCDDLAVLLFDPTDAVVSFSWTPPLPSIGLACI